MTDITTIDFHGDRLFVFEQASVPYVAMRPIVEALGLDWSGQLQRIRRDEVLNPSVVMMPTVTNAGEREAVCLPIHLLNGWLFGVDAARVRPELRERITLYRRECFQVLADYFGADVEDAPPVFPVLVDGLNLQERRQLVNEARVTFCRQSAQELWIQLGLPTTPTMLNRGRPPSAERSVNVMEKAFSLIKSEPGISRRELVRRLQGVRVGVLNPALQQLVDTGQIVVREKRALNAGRPTVMYSPAVH